MESKQINLAQCYSNAKFIDPLVVDVTSFHYEVQYDISRYVFDPVNSGPVGAFAIGGDVGPGPGVGTELIQLLPVGGFNRGTPLPGSTYTYTDTGGIVTIDLTFASPASVTDDGNVFLTSFNYITPIFISNSKFKNLGRVGYTIDLLQKYHAIAFSEAKYSS